MGLSVVSQGPSGGRKRQKWHEPTVKTKVREGFVAVFERK
jgi:hypothetical protein